MSLVFRRLSLGVVLGAWALSIGGAGGVALADDAKAREALQKGRDLYAQREDLAKIDEAIKILAEAETAAAKSEDTDLKYDILIAHGRAIYYKGVHTTGDKNKIPLFEAAYGKSKAAKELSDDYADGYFYYGVALARWAEAKGVLESLNRKKELFENMEGAMERDTREAKAGDSIDGYGPNRVIGRAYFKLPVFAGGNRGKALENLKKAVDGAPNFVLNTIYYAETLYDGDAAEKKQACELLDNLLKKNPAEIDPNRVPESKEEFVDAQKLRSEMKCK
ncbi:MAG: hypothetical protein AB7P04_07770 [Bacteriovoracia bacterium]